MKRTIFNCAAAALIALPILAEEKQSTSSSVITSADGTATITIDVNGKKETKTFKLGDGGQDRIDLKDGKVVGEPGKKVTYIGIAPGAVGDDLRAHLPLKDGEGIKVNHVAEGSPAAKAGIQEHDILLRLDDQILVEPEQLRALVKMRKPGDEVKVNLMRKGEQKEVKVVLAESEERPTPQNMFRLKGGDLLKQMEGLGKKPGALFQHKGIVIGPDGKTHTFDSGDLGDVAEATRKLMESANMSKEQIESVLGAIKGAAKGAIKEPKELHELFKDKDTAPKDEKLEEKK